ncbi:MAG TPA: hypothetical protein VE978_05655 [Chitinophagales bacterium]|nr:hypothetical protein [Chitinophagales bacterium]
MKKAVVIFVIALACACKHEKPITQTEPSDQSVTQRAPQNFNEENSYPITHSTFTKVKKEPCTANAFVENNCDDEFRVPVTEFLNDFYSGNQSPAEYLATRYAPQQAFEINSNEFNTLVGMHGTVLQLPPSTFMLNDSTPYVGPVRVELREVLSKAQMVFANFSTTSNGTPLESAGMIYWNATSEDGQQLQLDSGAFVSVTLPGRLNAKDYQLFTGNVKRGMMNWSLYPTPDWPLYPTQKTALPLAIISRDYFHFKSYRIPWNVLKHNKNLNETWNDQITALANGRYANTELSTKEFLRRVERIKWMGWNSDLLALYMDNPNDLNRADSLAVLQMAVYAANIKESSYSISKKYLAIGASKRRWIRENTRAFRKFFEESKLYDQEIFVNAKELRLRSLKKLESRGIDKEYARYLMRGPVYHQQILSGYRIDDDPRNLVSYPNVSAIKTNTKAINLRIPAMGYINCDRFLESSVKKDVIVQIENYSEMENVSSLLILKNINSVMNGDNINGTFTFKDVPSDYKMCWVIIGSCDGKLYYQMQDVSPNEASQGIVKAVLKATTVEELEKTIKSLSS